MCDNNSMIIIDVNKTFPWSSFIASSQVEKSLSRHFTFTWFQQVHPSTTYCYQHCIFNKVQQSQIDIVFNFQEFTFFFFLVLKKMHLSAHSNIAIFCTFSRDRNRGGKKLKYTNVLNTCTTLVKLYIVFITTNSKFNITQQLFEKYILLITSKNSVLKLPHLKWFYG